MTDLGPNEAKTPVPCPNCGHANLKEVGWLKTHDSFACENCGRSVTVNREQLFGPIEQLADDMDDTQEDYAEHIVPDDRKS